MAENAEPKFKDTDDWFEWWQGEYYYYGEGEEEEYETEEEEEMLELDEIEADDEKSEEDEIDLLTASPAEIKRKKELALKKERLQKLLGTAHAKRRPSKDASVETIITPEEAPVRYRAETESELYLLTHPCLKEIEISESRLKLQNLFTVFPVPDDPGIVPAFWTIEERSAMPADLASLQYYKFVELAKIEGLRPIGCTKDMFQTDNFDLRYYGLDSRVMKVLCAVLFDNTYVEILDLKDNWLTTTACYYLNQLLQKNNVMTHLSLSGCRIGPRGIRLLGEGIMASMSLEILDLDSCDLGDEGLTYVSQTVRKSESIRTLTLHDNNLTEASAADISGMLLGSETLKDVDLSWNSLYTHDAWKNMLSGLLGSQTLTDLNLAWNALDKECLTFLVRLIIRSATLKRLNISGNRFTEEEAESISRALTKNTILEEFYAGKNPLKAQGAHLLILALLPETAPESNLRLLDLEGVWANRDIVPSLEIIENEKPWLEIRLGGILSNYKIVEPDPRKIFLKRANFEAKRPKIKRQRKNFGHFILTLEDKPIKKGRFKKLVKKFKLKLSDSLIDEIINVFPGPKNTVDQAYLKAFYLQEYPDTKPPPVKIRKKTKEEELAEKRKLEKERLEKEKKEQEAKKAKKKSKKLKDMWRDGEECAYFELDVY